ncbi:hypothetical protein Pcinc_026963 [Petrolisthes cinctipes]|uniref:Uncharacterized protein n=1 Tax=Petrolisthes cinctipes TaxID=88211 RepID=A0AAE1KAY2_PETCI|nr:hypothetical protein Pcinc_026963 [Petrolisthes cinctipes]
MVKRGRRREEVKRGREVGKEGRRRREGKEGEEEKKVKRGREAGKEGRRRREGKEGEEEEGREGVLVEGVIRMALSTTLAPLLLLLHRFKCWGSSFMVMVGGGGRGAV